MSTKTSVMLGLFIGSTIGGYVPVFFGSSFLSYASLIGSTIGSIVGVYIGYKLTNY